MAKSIRSKRRQRVLAVRREKYREKERKKCWDHQLKRQREKAEAMDGVQESQSCDNTDQGTNEDCVATGVGSVADEGVGSDVVMETDADKPKFSKKYLDKVSRSWRSRGDKRKKKRLLHTRKDKW